MSGGGPGAAAGLQQPAADIFEQADGSTDAAFVGKVQVACSCRDDGGCDFSASKDHVPELRKAARLPYRWRRPPSRYHGRPARLLACQRTRMRPAV